MIRSSFCGLMPHPPIIVPDVGGDRATQCQSTVDACRTFARRLVATAPDRLFLVSPHSPMHRESFGLWSGERLRGDLARFGATESKIDLPNDHVLLDQIRAAALRRGVSTWSIPSNSLDHGATVPLYFLAEAGWRGPTSIVSLAATDNRGYESFGTVIARAQREVGGSIALIASGDMTHRAKPGAPCGYHERGVEFDQKFCDLVAAGKLDKLREIDLDLRECAAEDSTASSVIVSTAIDNRAHAAEVLSYEHPFGVGYLVAVFQGEGALA